MLQALAYHQNTPPDKVLSKFFKILRNYSQKLIWVIFGVFTLVFIINKLVHNLLKLHQIGSFFCKNHLPGKNRRFEPSRQLNVQSQQ